MDSNPKLPSLDGVNLGDLNYTVHIPYNGTIPTGGNSLLEDLNVHYDVGLTTVHQSWQMCNRY